MKKEYVETLVRARILRRRQADIKSVKSLVDSAGVNAKIAKKIPLDGESATLVFREIYESIRQLGDACWRLNGYEPLNHDISLDGLKIFEVSQSFKFNLLPIFKKIRHDANYKGFIVSLSQTKEIIDFWDNCGKEVIDKLYKVLNKTEELEQHG